MLLGVAAQGPHFWDECPFPPQGPCQAGPSGDFQAYINLFSRAADLIRTRPNAITGALPLHACLLGARRQCAGQCCCKRIVWDRGSAGTNEYFCLNQVHLYEVSEHK